MPDEPIPIKGKVLIIAMLTARAFCIEFPIPGKVYIIYVLTISTKYIPKATKKLTNNKPDSLAWPNRFFPCIGRGKKGLKRLGMTTVF